MKLIDLLAAAEVGWQRTDLGPLTEHYVIDGEGYPHVHSGPCEGDSIAHFVVVEILSGVDEEPDEGASYDEGPDEQQLATVRTLMRKGIADLWKVIDALDDESEKRQDAPQTICPTCGDDIPSGHMCAKASCTMARMPVIDDPAVSAAMRALEHGPEEPNT